MTLKKEYILLVLVIAALAVYVFVQKKGKTHYELPEIKQIEEKDISKLVLTKGDSEIILIREGDKWFISPLNFPADTWIIDNMLYDIKNLKLTALVSESKNYSLYELDKDNRLEVTAYTGDTTVSRKIDIGRIAPSRLHTFIRLDNNHRVFYADGNIRHIFDHTVPKLRDKKIMMIEENITELNITTREKELTIVRLRVPDPEDKKQEEEKKEESESRQKSVWETSDGKPVKADTVTNLIAILKEFSCDEFIEGKKKEDYTSPVYTISLAGRKIYTISLFDKQDSTSPGISSESEYPFYLSEQRAKSIMINFDDLIESKQ